MVVATDVLTTVERLSAGHSKSKKKKNYNSFYISSE